MIWYLACLVIVGLDQVSKMVVRNNLQIGQRVKVIDKFFYLIHIENHGAALGMMQNGRYLLVVTTGIVAICAAYYLAKTQDIIIKIALTFILGGAFGNLIDRVIRGSVSDFLAFYLGTYHFPNFNVADTFIVIGTAILIIYMSFYKQKGGEAA